MNGPGTPEQAGTAGEKRSPSTTPDGVSINVRRVNFEFPENLSRRWFNGSPFRSFFATALSMTFPAAEDHFIVAGVKPYLKRIEDNKLRSETKGFIAQEVIHSREHQKLNRAIGKQFKHLDRLDDLERAYFEAASKAMPDSLRLALSAALEHMTAAFGQYTLTHPEDWEGVEPAITELFKWHALEEMEHKSVAYDIHEMTGGTQLTRVVALLVGVHIFAPVVVTNLIYLAAADGVLFNGELVKDFLKHREFLKSHNSPGLMGTMIKGVIPYLHPRHSPWGHNDDRHLVKDSERYYPDASLQVGGRTPEPVV